MSLELSNNGYGDIMQQVQKIENLVNEGVFPNNGRGLSRTNLLLELSSETRKLRQIIQENHLILPTKASPDGPRAA